MSRYEFGFLTPPPVGFTFTVDGQPYTVTRIEAWSGDTDPGPRFNVHYKAPCATCEATFEGWFRHDRMGLTRRCPDHKSPGARVPRRVHSWPPQVVA